MTENQNPQIPGIKAEKPACDPSISRKEFLEAVVRRATIAGVLLAAPVVVDKFLVPPVYAANSTTNFHDSTDLYADHQHITRPRFDTPGAGSTDGINSGKDDWG